MTDTETTDPATDDVRQRAAEARAAAETAQKRRVERERARIEGENLRYNMAERPAVVRELPPGYEILVLPEYLEALHWGWDRMDVRVKATALHHEGAELFRTGKPLPDFFGFATYAAAEAELKRISGVRVGFKRANTDRLAELRRKELFGTAPDHDHRGHALPTDERKQHGRLKTEAVTTLSGTARVRVDPRPTLLHKLAHRFPRDIRKEGVLAGLRLRADWEAAGCHHRVTATYEILSSRGEHEMSERQVAADIRLQRACKEAWLDRLIAERQAVLSAVINETDPGMRIGFLKTGLEALRAWYEKNKDLGAPEDDDDDV